MKYKYLDNKPLPQRPIKEHVYVPTDKDIALSEQMRELSERIEEQLKNKWKPSIGDTVIYIDEPTIPQGYTKGGEGAVTYLGHGWFQVTWDSIGTRSYGMNCIVSEWIVKAP